jgi:hypothetical protein
VLLNGDPCRYSDHMNWNFTIHPDYPDTPTTVRDLARAAPPTSIWAIGNVPGDDQAEWAVGLRFVIRDGYPLLAEQRLFPKGGTPFERSRGRWSVEAAAVPALGLPASLVKNLAIGGMEEQVRAALADYKDPAWGDSRDVGPEGEPPNSWFEWFEAKDVMGIDTDDTTQRRKRGRKPLTDEHLAEVAYHYVEAIRSNKKAHLYIEIQMKKKGDKRPPAAQWIKKARERGFLTSTPKPGQRGGTITPKAIAILTEIDFLDEQGARSAEHEGDES